MKNQEVKSEVQAPNGNEQNIQVLVKHVADLTRINNHSEARLMIANHFSYLKHFSKKFEAIIVIHKLEGCLPISISDYRTEKTKDMLNDIRRNEGQEICNLIYNSL
jgi:hypothetical protein